MFNPFRFVSKKVVDVTLSTEVTRLRELVSKQDEALVVCLRREELYLAAVSELCEQQTIIDNLGNRIVSTTGFIDFAKAFGKVNSL